MNVAYNVDCMEFMKTLPDKAFDLAVVDPPYGDGIGERDGQTWNRFGERFDRYKTERSLTQHTAQERERERENATAKSPCLRIAEGRPSAELVEHGRRSSEKNHSVGRSPETGIFRRTVSRLTEPDYLGGQLLPTSTDAVFSDMEKNQRA